jgi:hypothetical protein
MKLSELKKEIKDNIYEILSEESVEEGTYVGAEAIGALEKDPKFAAAKDKSTPLNTLKSGGSVTLEEEDPQVKKINDKIQKDPEFLKKTKEAMAKAEKGDSTDLAMLMGGFGKMFESDDEDREPTKAELEKEKVKGAPSKFKVPQADFEDFKTKLKTLVKKIKDMEKGAEKDKKMAALKQFIKKPELVKAFKERDVKIDTGDLVG